MKRLQDDSDAPVARRGTLPKISFQAQRARQSYIPLARGRMGTPGYVNKGGGRKRVCGGFWS